MSERLGIDGSFGRLLERQLDFIFELWDEFKRGIFPRPILQEKASEHVENIKVALIFTATEAKNSKSSALAHDLLGRFSTLWTFLTKRSVMCRQSDVIRTFDWKSLKEKLAHFHSSERRP